MRPMMRPAAEQASLSVVVPVYNSASSVKALTARVSEALADREFEVVLVNDGSSDQSWERIVEAANTDRRVRGLDLARNYGQHNALLAGIRAARGGAVVTRDDGL